jgi:hypothetical protein
MEGDVGQKVVVILQRSGGPCVDINYYYQIRSSSQITCYALHSLHTIYLVDRAIIVSYKWRKYMEAAMANRSILRAEGSSELRSEKAGRANLGIFDRI